MKSVIRSTLNLQTGTDIVLDSDLLKVEVSFWSLMNTGLYQEPFKVWYASGFFVEKSAYKYRKRRIVISYDDISNPSSTDSRWHIGNINQGGLLQHIEKIPGINKPMLYIGVAFSFFPYHVEDEHLG